MGRHSLMLIEDEASVVESLREALLDDYEVSTVGSGEEAITVMKNRNIDLILLDVRLPGMSGITVLRIIKNIDNAIPVIIISGSDSVDIVVQGFRYGAWDYFDKPFSIDALKASVEAAIQQSMYKDSEAGGGPLSVDMEELIHDTLEYSLSLESGLQSALQRFRERYIELVEQKTLHSL